MAFIRVAVCASLVFALACGGEPPPEPEPDPTCDQIDRICPAAVPFDGAPCEGTLSCTFVDAEAFCEDGRWAVTQLCIGCAPPLAESCASPFSGALAGASVALGHADLGTFRAFSEGERISPSWGAQGLAMVGYRVDVAGVATAEVPSCVHTRVTVSMDGGMPETTERDLALRCGRSLSVLDILPELPCAFRDYSVDLEVELVGVGVVSRTLAIEGGGCPRR